MKRNLIPFDRSVDIYIFSYVLRSDSINFDLLIRINLLLQFDISFLEFKLPRIYLLLSMLFNNIELRNHVL